MFLPNAPRAFIDMAKLRDYCLNPDHPEGKHKARVFRSAIGLESADAEWLRDRLLEAVATVPCSSGGMTYFGQRYSLDFQVVRHGNSAILRSAWIVRSGEEFARLTSCYVL